MLSESDQLVKVKAGASSNASVEGNVVLSTITGAVVTGEKLW